MLTVLTDEIPIGWAGGIGVRRTTPCAQRIEFGGDGRLTHGLHHLHHMGSSEDTSFAR